MYSKKSLDHLVTTLIIYGLGLVLFAGFYYGVRQLLADHVSTALVRPAPAASVSRGWQEFSGPEAAFSILFPAPPVEGLQLPPHTPVEQARYTVTAEENNVTYAVSYYDDPTGGDSAASLDASRDELLKRLAATAWQEAPLSRAGGPEREVTFVYAGGEGLAHLYLIGQRLYQISVYGPSEAFDRIAAKAFLNAFTVAENHSEQAAYDQE